LSSFHSSSALCTLWMPAALASERGLSIHGAGTRAIHSPTTSLLKTGVKSGTGSPTSRSLMRQASLSRNQRAWLSPMPGMRRCSRSEAATSTS